MVGLEWLSPKWRRLCTPKKPSPCPELCVSFYDSVEAVFAQSWQRDALGRRVYGKMLKPALQKDVTISTTAQSISMPRSGED